MLFRLSSLLLLFCSAPVIAQSVRINEVSRAADLPVALQHVELEVYNAGTESVDLRGMRFYVGSKFQEVEQPFELSPGSFTVFTFGRKQVESTFDMDLKLPWDGATIMLWDASVTKLLDIFSYPSLQSQGFFRSLPRMVPVSLPIRMNQVLGLHVRDRWLRVSEVLHWNYGAPKLTVEAWYKPRSLRIAW